ncbi:hypothetical protein NIES970_04700 [[Synechococcus] sp. NIES-970]|nr:hypothetical protein NIES970_04700 [[Synechococcus] sp. NIES-970]
MASQWENFLKNLGNWRGSFAGVTLEGEIMTEVPSILTLSLVNGDRDKVLFTLRRFGGHYRRTWLSSLLPVEKVVQLKSSVKWNGRSPKASSRVSLSQVGQLPLM